MNEIIKEEYHCDVAPTHCEVIEFDAQGNEVSRRLVRIKKGESIMEEEKIIDTSIEKLRVAGLPVCKSDKSVKKGAFKTYRDIQGDCVFVHPEDYDMLEEECFKGATVGEISWEAFAKMFPGGEQV